jgi:hypothetical protein
MGWYQVFLVLWITLFVLSLALVERAECIQGMTSRLVRPAGFFLAGSALILFVIATGWTLLEKLASSL